MWDSWNTASKSVCRQEQIPGGMLQQGFPCFAKEIMDLKTVSFSPKHLFIL